MKNEKTSKRVASVASPYTRGLAYKGLIQHLTMLAEQVQYAIKIVKKMDKESRSVAASALNQAPDKKKK